MQLWRNVLIGALSILVVALALDAYSYRTAVLEAQPIEKARAEVSANSGENGQANKPTGDPGWVVSTWRWITHDGVTFFTVWVAAFTGALVFVTNRQISALRDEFNATHRPQLEVRFVRSVGKAVKITVINTGTGQAKFVAARGAIWHLQAGAAFPSPDDLTQDMGFVLRTTFGPSDSDSHTITNAADAFTSGFSGLSHVFGWIIYDTVAPTPVRRTTYFGRKVVPLQSELVPVDGSDWNFIQ